MATPEPAHPRAARIPTSLTQAGPQRARSDRSFERLYDRHVKTVYRYTLAVLRNPADAEDVTQTTFMNAYRAFRRGERPRAPENWLIRIAHNVCRQRYRESGRRPQEVPLQEGVAEAAAAEVDITDVAELLEALGQLSFNQRAAIVLREFEGRSYAEIAETLGLSVRAVEMSIFRARRALRQRRSGLRALGGVPLPGSLYSFGSSRLADGAALAGSGLVAKALAVVAVGVVVGGAGYSSVRAVVRPESPARAERSEALAGAPAADRGKPSPGRVHGAGLVAVQVQPVYNHHEVEFLDEEAKLDHQSGTAPARTARTAPPSRPQAKEPTAPAPAAPAQSGPGTDTVKSLVEVGRDVLPVQPPRQLPSVPPVTALAPAPAPPAAPAVPDEPAVPAVPAALP